MSTTPRISVGIVGAGAVAHALCSTLTRSDEHPITIWARSPGAAISVATLGHGSAEQAAELSDLASCDAILIAVSDTAITEVAAQLDLALGEDSRTRSFFHTSGALTGAEALAPLARQGDEGARALGSLHPLVAVAKDRLPGPDLFVGMPFATESTGPLGTSVASALVRSMGGTELELPTCGTQSDARRQKLRYHALATMVASGVVTLVDRAAAVMSGDVGNDPGTRDRFRMAYAELARSAVANVQRADGAGVLTGAIARADEGLVTAHLESLQGTTSEALYRAIEAAACQMLNGPEADELGVDP